MKNQKFIFTAFFFMIIISMQAEAVQNVYEYQNSEGVTEFTDEIKANKEPEKHIQIKKMTPEEEALSKDKLEQIKEKDKALDKRLARERQLENERRLRYQEEQASKKRKQQSEEEDDSKGSWYGRMRRPRPGMPQNPDRPVRPNPGPGPGLR